MHENPSANVADGNVIREGVSEELDELRRLQQNGKDYLLEIQQRESQLTGIPSLKIGFNKVFGYYLEVTNAHKDKAPEAWIRKQTLTNAERYITEELKVYEEKILNAQGRILTLEAELYQVFLHHMQVHIHMLQHNAKLIASLDMLMGFALVSQKRNYVKPEVSKEDVLDIRQGRHPVIDRPFGSSLSICSSWRDAPYL